MINLYVKIHIYFYSEDEKKQEDPSTAQGGDNTKYDSTKKALKEVSSIVNQRGRLDGESRESGNE